MNKDFKKELSKSELQDISSQIGSLGFAHFRSILATAQYASPLIAYPEGRFYLQDPNDYPNDVGYLFLIAKTKEDGTWKLREVEVGVELETTRTESGRRYIGKSYDCSLRSIPSMEQMAREIANKIRLAQAQEILHNDKELDAEFNRLGFNDPYSLIFYINSLSDFSFFRVLDKIVIQPDGKEEDILFRIISFYDETKKQSKIVSISAALEREIEIDGAKTPKKYLEQYFGTETGQLPTKQEIKNNFQASAQQLEQINIAKEVLQLSTITQNNKNKHQSSPKRGLKPKQ